MQKSEIRNKDEDIMDIDFDTSLSRLKEIVKTLEDDSLSIEKGLDLFKEGCELIKKLREYLHHSKQIVEIYSSDIIKEMDIEEF